MKNKPPSDNGKKILQGAKFKKPRTLFSLLHYSFPMEIWKFEIARLKPLPESSLMNLPTPLINHILYQQAVDYQTQGNTAQGIEILHQLLEVFPEYPFKTYLWNLIGEWHYHQFLYDEAEQAFLTARSNFHQELDLENSDSASLSQEEEQSLGTTIHFNLGRTYMAKDLYSMAKGAFEQGLELTPTHTSLLLNLARVQYLEEAYEEQLDTLRKLLRAQGDVAEAWYWVGMGFLKQNQYEQAEQAFLQAVKTDNHYRAAIGGLAKIAWHRDDVSRAEELFLAALQAENVYQEFEIFSVLEDLMAFYEEQGDTQKYHLVQEEYTRVLAEYQAQHPHFELD